MTSKALGSPAKASFAAASEVATRVVSIIFALESTAHAVKPLSHEETGRPMATRL
jgi:hypothetical protein